MKFLKATVLSSNDMYDGKTEFFALDKILNIQPHKSGFSKILLGPGLYWDVNTDSMEIVALSDDALLSEIRRANR